MQAGNRNCPATIYAPDQVKYVSTKLVAVYAVKRFGIAPDLFSGLQVELIVHCVTFVTYNNNNNTYKYIVFFIDINRTYNGNRNNISHMYGYYKHNMDLDIDGINKLYNKYTFRIL